MTTILGIETSCDETAAAVVDDGVRVRAAVVASQIDLHAPYGGIVPEVACRAHDMQLLPVLDAALQEAGITDPAREIAAIAVTNRPGLIGALLIGLAGAKTLAHVWGLPLIAVDHLDGHLHAAAMAVAARLPAMLDTEPEAGELYARGPVIGLIVSGGHTLLVRAAEPTEVTLLGATQDDAAGEAFDKVASLLGLGYPGGPAIQRAAAGEPIAATPVSRGLPSGAPGDPRAIALPRALLDRADAAFSFSGLKTAVLYALGGPEARGASGLPPAPDDARLRDVAASFEQAAADVLAQKAVDTAMREGCRTIALTGGVAANARLRRELCARAQPRGVRVVAPPIALCTDNAAFIAGLGYWLLQAGEIAPETVDASPRTRASRRAGSRPKS